jgi:protoheme ferro-lyase
MLVMSLFIALVVLAAVVSGLHEIPERARKGEFFKQQVAQHYSHVSESLLKQLQSSALTWQAPVDHFDLTNNATFAQR